MTKITLLAAVSFELALAAAACLFVWPVYTGIDGERPVRATLLQVNGEWAIVPILLPAAIAVLPLLFRMQKVCILAAVLMGAFALIAMSIGLFYIPAAILMLSAACLADPETQKACGERT